MELQPDIGRFVELEALPLAALKELVRKYPAAAIPAMVAARKARIENDADFEQLLAHAALRLPSRSILKEYVLSSLNKPASLEHPTSEPVLADPIPSQETATFQEETTAAEPELDQLYASQAYAANMEAEISELPTDLIANQIELRNKPAQETEPAEQTLEQEPNTINETNDAKSFLDWLTDFSETSEQPTEQVAETAPQPTEKAAEGQSLKREIKEEELESSNMELVQQRAKKSISKDKSFYTETLAKIYWDQKKWKQAIEVYDVLRLKYPEKSTYFAAQIELLKENLK